MYGAPLVPEAPRAEEAAPPDGLLGDNPVVNGAVAATEVPVYGTADDELADKYDDGLVPVGPLTLVDSPVVNDGSEELGDSELDFGV